MIITDKDKKHKRKRTKETYKREFAKGLEDLATVVVALSLGLDATRPLAALLDRAIAQEHGLATRPAELVPVENEAQVDDGRLALVARRCLSTGALLFDLLLGVGWRLSDGEVAGQMTQTARQIVHAQLVKVRVVRGRLADEVREVGHRADVVEALERRRLAVQTAAAAGTTGGD